jgi:hypothetical protein
LPPLAVMAIALRPARALLPLLWVDPQHRTAACLQHCQAGNPLAPRRFEGDCRHVTGRQPVSQRGQVDWAGANPTPRGGLVTGRHRHIMSVRSAVEARRMKIDSRPWGGQRRSRLRRAGSVGLTSGQSSRPELGDRGTGSGRGSCGSEALCHTGAGHGLLPRLSARAPGAILINGHRAPRSHRPHPTRGLPLRIDTPLPQFLPRIRLRSSINCLIRVRRQS